jgi:hypothetical protein
VRYESCGVERDDLAVGTAATALGVLCLTLCPRGAAADNGPAGRRRHRRPAGHAAATSTSSSANDTAPALFTTNPDDFERLLGLLTVVPVTRPAVPSERR